ncbi:hypothetical protein STXM2123_4308 [Streptomyces sp. F-3]|nr:hypothetical protein STXM2123_4308 [Streptomyces sp. F-3]
MEPVRPRGACGKATMPYGGHQAENAVPARVLTARMEMRQRPVHATA